MRVLVTGGAGYIGSHAARCLSQGGHKVLVVDNLSTGHRRLADGFELILENIGNQEKLIPLLKSVDVVFHFAAHSYVGESIINPRKYFENNLQAGISLLAAVVEAGAPYFIFSSTCAVYGIPSQVPIAESAARLPISPYGASKLAFEMALEAYARAYSLKFVSLRYFNAAGADAGGGIGEMHQPETHLIPQALWVAAGQEPHIEIYGSDYPTPDGTCIRDYVHVSDLAEAHVLAMEYLANGGESLGLNLGSGTGYSILEVLSCIERVTGLSVPRRVCARRPGDPPKLVADSRQAQKILGWTPARGLEEIVGSAWKWTQSLQSLST